MFLTRLTLRLIPYDDILHIQLRGNLKSNVNMFVWEAEYLKSTSLVWVVSDLEPRTFGFTARRLVS
jgi:hypothetical protein